MSVLEFKNREHLTAMDLIEDIKDMSENGPKGKATDLVTITGWDDGTITLGHSKMKLQELVYYLKAADIMVVRDMES